MKNVDREIENEDVEDALVVVPALTVAEEETKIAIDEADEIVIVTGTEIEKGKEESAKKSIVLSVRGFQVESVRAEAVIHLNLDAAAPGPSLPFIRKLGNFETGTLLPQVTKA
jgi:hypothetical protein